MKRAVLFVSACCFWQCSWECGVARDWLLSTLKVTDESQYWQYKRKNKGLNLTYIIYKYFFIYCYSSVETELTKHPYTLVVPNFLNTLIFFSVVKYSLSGLSDDPCFLFTESFRTIRLQACKDSNWNSILNVLVLISVGHIDGAQHMLTG